MACALSKTALGPVLHEAERNIDPDQSGLVWTAERGEEIGVLLDGRQSAAHAHQRSKTRGDG